MVDVFTIFGLLLCLFWGARHGALRQVMGLGVLLACFSMASVFGPRLEEQVRKVATLTPDGLSCAAYLAVWFSTGVAGGVVMHLLRHAIARVPARGRVGRGVGAFVGVVQGVLVLGLLLHGVLGWFAPAEGPAGVVALRKSRTARALSSLEEFLRPTLRLPGGVSNRVDGVRLQITAEPAP